MRTDVSSRAEGRLARWRAESGITSEVEARPRKLGFVSTTTVVFRYLGSSCLVRVVRRIETLLTREFLTYRWCSSAAISCFKDTPATGVSVAFSARAGRSSSPSRILGTWINSRCTKIPRELQPRDFLVASTGFEMKQSILPQRLRGGNLRTREWRYLRFVIVGFGVEVSRRCSLGRNRVS